MITIQKASKKDYKDFLSGLIQKATGSENSSTFYKMTPQSSSSLKSIYFNENVCGYLTLTQDSDNFRMQGIYIFPDFYSICNLSTLFKELVAYIKGIHPSPCTLMVDRSVFKQVAT